MATSGVKIPSSGDTTPEYNAIQQSSRKIENAIRSIAGDFVSQAHSCGLIPTRNPSSPPLEVVLNEISVDPVNYYSLQHVLATLNVRTRFNDHIRRMETTFQLEMRKYIPASAPEDPEAEPENRPRVFISFSRRKVFGDSPDAYAEAKGLYDELKAKECKPWMDEKGIEFGDNLTKEIFKAIKQCDFIIPIMTGGYATSLWCLRELYYAALQTDPKRPKTIIPMLLEDEAVIDNQKAGKWLLSIGMAQNNFRKEKKDAVIKFLKDKIVKTQEKLSHPSTGAHGNMSVECSKFISSMKGKYQERRINREKQWPPCHSDKLVRLELVEREKGEGYSANTQRGKKSKAIKRTPLPYGNLFKVESGKRRVRKVLVEGDAGIGKTTLCTAVSENWANGKLFQQFELVLLLPLRMKAVASAGSLPELLQLLHSDPHDCDSVARYLQKDGGESVLIIADGWDELGESRRHEDSFLYQFLFDHRFCLMSVVVTSRPSASAPLRELPDIDRFVEVRGFSKEHIFEYIKSEFTSDKKKADSHQSEFTSDQGKESEFISGQGKADRLREQLEGNPLVESVCSVPLNCAIICHLWRTLEEEALPTTMTELYTKILCSLTFRDIYVRKTDSNKSILVLPTLESLLADPQQSLLHLCRFAFWTLEKDQLVFSQEELEAFFPEGLALDKSFGLLQSANLIGVGKSFHFLHLTFQEFLAALYLTRQPTDKQLEIFQSHLLYHRSVMLLRFFFGLNDFGSDVAIISDILRLQMPEDEVSDLLSDTPLTIWHCAFEAHDNLIKNEIIQFIISSSFDNQNMIQFGYPHTAHDWAAMLHVLDNMPKCDSDIVIDIGDFGFKDNQIKKLIDIVASKKGKLQIKELSLANGFKLTMSGLQMIEKAIRADLLPSLINFTLGQAFTFDTDGNVKLVTAFVEALSAHCPDLDCLDFSDNNLGVHGLLAMLKIRDHHSTCTLVLDNTNLGDEGLVTLSENLEGYMFSLRLRNNGIHASGVSCLADAVCSGKAKISYRLSLNNNPLGLEGINAVGRMLRSSHCTLTVIELSNCNLTTAGGDLPNTNSLNPVSITSCVAIGQHLCQIPQCKTMKYIYLDGNSFTGEGIHILAGFLRLCPHLTNLHTHNCGITSDDLIWLLHKLTEFKSSSCSKLKVWLLMDNQIDDSGVSALMDHLPLFPCLGCDYVTVHFDNPGISSKMIKRLDEKLRRRKQLLSTSESFSDGESSNDEDSPSDYEESPSDEKSPSDESPNDEEESPSVEESPNDEDSPTGHEDKESSSDKSNYSKESTDCNEQIISEGSASDSGSDTSLDLQPPPTKRSKQDVAAREGKTTSHSEATGGHT